MVDDAVQEELHVLIADIEFLWTKSSPRNFYKHRGDPMTFKASISSIQVDNLRSDAEFPVVLFVGTRTFS